MKSSLLPQAALWARRRYRWIFAVTAMLFVICVALASRLSFDTDVLNLLPQNDPRMTAFRETLEEFGSVHYLLVAVRMPEEAVLDPYEEFVDRLGARLESVAEIEEVDYRIGELAELLRTFMPRSLLFLESPALERLAEKLGDEALEMRSRELRRLLTMPQALAMKDLLRLDPLGLSEIFIELLGGSRGGLAIDWTRGHFLSNDHRMMLILARPTRPPQDIEFNRRMTAAVNAQVDDLLATWSEFAGPDSEPPEVALGGTYPIALEDANLITRDAIVNFVTSMLGVLVLFLLAFRRLSLLLYAFVPLTFGLALAIGVSALIFGELSSATSGVAALLIGLGIDFIIVSYGRFVEERRRGASLTEGLATMSGSSGRAVVVGAVTSAATFYAFAVTDFKGLLQMGLLTGTGILLCMLAVLFLLPAMLSWSEDHHERRASRPRLILHGFGSARLIRYSMHHPRAVLAAGAVLTVALGFAALGIEFEDSVRNMRPAGNKGVIVADEVAERYGSGFDYMMLVATGESAEEVIELAGTAEEGARRWIDGENLNGVEAITSIIPAFDRQREVLSWLEGEREGVVDVERIERTFRSALVAEGLRVEAFAEGLDLLRQTLAPSGLIDAVEIRATAEGRRLIERYLKETPSGWKSVVYLYPPPVVWKRSPPPPIRELASELEPDVVLTGANILSEFLRGRVWKDAVVSAFLGLVLVGFLLWLDYRRLDDTLLSLVPLLIGITWMLGAMALLGRPLNFMNVFVTTMIIGIGVDYGVHVIHRYREVGRKDRELLESRLAETGKAIVLAALSTTVGFGSLSLSHYPGLQSMGLVAILGAIATCLVAVSLLPAYLALKIDRDGS